MPLSRPQSGLEPGSLYLEPPDLDDSLGVAVQVDRVLLRRHTPFQELAVVQSQRLGRMVLLDGYIQYCQYDEAAYHEMLVHVPLLTHPHPQRVLVIGGGDGATLREVLKHPSVEMAELCEIDAEVIAACREFLPGAAQAFDDPRVRVQVADGLEWVAAHPRAYDVILVDSSDPRGPATRLFGPEFYADLQQALRPGGLSASQAESFYLYGELIQSMFGFLQDLFPLTAYYNTLVPTYVSGVIGFILCSLGPDPLARPPDPRRLLALGPLDYYTSRLHQAAFALPGRLARLLPPRVAARQG